MRPEGKLAHLGVHVLPRTEAEFQDYVTLATGISAEYAEDLYRIFRLEPAMLFWACTEMRAECPQAWRLLLSNEFALATKAWPALSRAVPKCAFKNPLVQGFMLLAEFERCSLIMRHLAHANQVVDRPNC